MDLTSCVVGEDISFPLAWCSGGDGADRVAELAGDEPSGKLQLVEHLPPEAIVLAVAGDRIFTFSYSILVFYFEINGIAKAMSLQTNLRIILDTIHLHPAVSSF